MLKLRKVELELEECHDRIADSQNQMSEMMREREKLLNTNHVQKDEIGQLKDQRQATIKKSSTLHVEIQQQTADAQTQAERITALEEALNTANNELADTNFVLVETRVELREQTGSAATFQKLCDNEKKKRMTENIISKGHYSSYRHSFALMKHMTIRAFMTRSRVAKASATIMDGMAALCRRIYKDPDMIHVDKHIDNQSEIDSWMNKADALCKASRQQGSLMDILSHMSDMKQGLSVALDQQEKIKDKFKGISDAFFIRNGKLLAQVHELQEANTRLASLNRELQLKDDAAYSASSTALSPTLSFPRASPLKPKSVTSVQSVSPALLPPATTRARSTTPRHLARGGAHIEGSVVSPAPPQTGRPSTGLATVEDEDRIVAPNFKQRPYTQGSRRKSLTQDTDTNVWGVQPHTTSTSPRRRRLREGSDPLASYRLPSKEKFVAEVKRMYAAS
jgi:hypothetical protein